MSSLNHTKLAPAPVGFDVVGARPNFDPAWVFQEVEAAISADSMAVCDDISDILANVSKYNANPDNRLKAIRLLARCAG